MKKFSKIPSIKAIVSEEQDSIKNINSDGEFLIAYDPLDGSSLVDVNLALVQFLVFTKIEPTFHILVVVNL